MRSETWVNMKLRVTLLLWSVCKCNAIHCKCSCLARLVLWWAGQRWTTIEWSAYTGHCRFPFPCFLWSLTGISPGPNLHTFNQSEVRSLLFACSVMGHTDDVRILISSAYHLLSPLLHPSINFRWWTLCCSLYICRPKRSVWWLLAFPFLLRPLKAYSRP